MSHRTESMHVHYGLYLISTCFSLLIQYSSKHTLYYVCIIMLPIYGDDDRVVLQGMRKTPTKKFGTFQQLILSHLRCYCYSSAYNFRYSYNLRGRIIIEYMSYSLRLKCLLALSRLVTVATRGRNDDPVCQHKRPQPV